MRVDTFEMYHPVYKAFSGKRRRDREYARLVVQPDSLHRPIWVRCFVISTEIRRMVRHSRR